MATAATGALKWSRDTIAGAHRSAAGVFAIRVAGAGCGYATQVLLARLMGEAGYGIFATAWVWIIILGHASVWGLTQALCRFVPHHRVRGELDLARGFLAGGAAVTLATAVLFALCGAGLLWLGQGQIGEPYVAPLKLALLVLPVFALQDYLEGVARSFNWTALAIAPPFVLRQLLIAASMALAVLFGAPADPAVAVGCTLIATTVAVAVQGAFLLARLRRLLPWGPRAYRFRTWAAATLPIALVDLTILGFSFVDVVVLGFFVPAEAVGIYFAATRIQQLALFAPYAATAATSARFAEAWARGEHRTLKTLVRSTVRLTTLASLVLGGGLLLIAPALLALFGKGFAASYGALTFLVAGVMLQSVFGPAEDLLTMLGEERVCALVSVIALGAAVVLNLVLIPAYGISGAAAAMALAWVGRAAALSFVAHRRLGVATHLLA